MMRRTGDKSKAVRTAFGAVIVLFAIGCIVFLQSPAWLVLALTVLGAGMVSPDFVVDLVKAWRK